MQLLMTIQQPATVKYSVCDGHQAHGKPTGTNEGGFDSAALNMLRVR